MNEYVVIVAAGSGTRFGASIPKQFCMLAGRPVLMHTIERCRQACPDAIFRLVLSTDMLDYWYSLCDEFNFNSPEIVFGGATRYDSVKAALRSLPYDDDAVIYVHDGARPLVCNEVIDRLRACIQAGSAAAVPVLHVSDSLRQIDETGHNQAVDRSRFVSIQTPQAFAYTTLQQAYAGDYQPQFTDDASVVESVCGIPVSLVEGSPMTIKITNRPDLSMVETLISECP